MRDDIAGRVRELAKRAGLGDVDPRVVGAALAVLGLALVFAAVRWWPRGDVPPAIAPGIVSSAVPATASAAAAPAVAGVVSAETSPAVCVWVHVVGAVRHPGTYELPEASRVEKAVDAAGGLLGNAAPEAVNLARRVEDGEQVVIPTQDQFKSGNVPAAQSGGGQSAAAGGSGATAGPLDLNTATADQLDGLPGIGPATATKILADRETNGPYASVEDLGRVAGIGPKKLEALKDLLSVR